MFNPIPIGLFRLKKIWGERGPPYNFVVKIGLGRKEDFKIFFQYF